MEHGILRREPYKDHRRTRMEYRLTDKGHDLYPILLAIRDWGDRYMAPDGPPVRYRHRGCGGEARVRARCAACDAALTAGQMYLEPGPGAPGQGSGCEVPDSAPDGPGGRPRSRPAPPERPGSSTAAGAGRDPVPADGA